MVYCVRRGTKSKNFLKFQSGGAAHRKISPTDLLRMTYIPNLTGVTQGSNPTTEVLASNGNQSLNVCINDPRTSYNEVSVAEPTPVAQIDFVYGINKVATSSNVNSNATVSVTSGILAVTSNGLVAASSSVLNAKKFVKFRAGQGVEGRFTAQFSRPALVNGSIAVAGLGFATANTTYLIDFAGFGYGNVLASTQFGILWRNNGSDNFIPQTSWNLDTCSGTTKSGFTLVPQSINSFQVQFQFCGNILFYVENPYTGRFILVHSVPNNLIAPTITNFQNPTTQLLWYSNSAAGSSNTLTTFGTSGGQFLEGQRRYNGPKGGLVNYYTNLPHDGVFYSVLAIKNATTYNGIPNRSQLHFRNVSVSCAGGGTNIALVKILKNPTATYASWTAYSGTGTDGISITAGNSTAFSNVASGITVTGGNAIFTASLANGPSSMIYDLTEYDIVAYPGDLVVLCIGVSGSANSADFGASLTWSEDL